MMLRCCCASLVLMRLFCTLWAESVFQYRIFGNYFIKLQMNDFNYLTMIFLCLAPQRFHFLKSGRVGRAASRGEQGLDAAEAALELAAGGAQRLLGIGLGPPRQVGHREKQVADLVSDARRGASGIELRAQLVDLLADLVEDRPQLAPFEADARGTALQLHGAGAALGRLVLLPGKRLRRRVGDQRVTEDMGMAAQHLVGDRAGDIVEVEEAGLLGHARMEDDLEEQIAELVLECCRIAALARLGHLIGLLDGVGSDGGEALLAVPGTAALGIAQPRHDVEQARQVRCAAQGAFSRARAMASRTRSAASSGPTQRATLTHLPRSR